MNLAIPKEIAPGETRVAAVPDTVKRYVQSGLAVFVEAGAGQAAHISDAAFEAAGAKIEPSAEKLLGAADIVLKVRKPWTEDGVDEVKRLRSGSILISLLAPRLNPELVKKLAAQGVTAFALDAIPRVTRAQPMDALSSQATVAGYKAVLIAADRMGKFMPMLMTAAGTISPARTFVIGAGVAGLQAIATARRLGSNVIAFDTRPVVQEQVQSLGAKFVGIDLAKEQAEGGGGYAKEVDDAILRKEQEIIGGVAKDSDVIVASAAVPGRPAPKLITRAAVAAMAPGSVVVDLAAEWGGNCEATVPGETVVVEGTTIVGHTNFPALLPLPASQMYARNVHSFLGLIWRKGLLNIDLADELLAGTLVSHAGKVMDPTAPTPSAATVAAKR